LRHVFEKGLIIKRYHVLKFVSYTSITHRISRKEVYDIM
jgi:hypothetical protein